MIDFKALPKDGDRFEALVCELLEKMGFLILQGPAIGPDGGRDILIERRLADVLGEKRERVVVQCKHFAHSGRAVAERDLGVWTNAIHKFGATGYLLVTSTKVTENLSRTFAEFTKTNNPSHATHWGREKLEVLLVGHPDVMDAFFPPTPPRLQRGFGSYGLGLVFPEGGDVDLVIEALGPLLELRAVQLRASGGDGDIKRFVGADGVRPGETALAWLARNGIGPGTPDPRRVPRFLILVGDPTQISFEFQTDLAIQYYVGRLPFEDGDDLRLYAEAVVRAEQGDPSGRPYVNFLAPSHPNDQATRRTSEDLVSHLVRELETRLPEGHVVQHVGAAATKSQMLEGFRDERFHLTFVAAHGLALGRDSESLLEMQGAHVSADWLGHGEIWSAQEHCLAAMDFDEQVDLGGKFFFLFSCYSAGTTTAEYNKIDGHIEIYSTPFVAALPRRLLTLGACGVIGHVGRAWTTSFSWVPEAPQPQTFIAVIESVLQGEPIGVALQALSKRYAELAVALASTEGVAGQDELVLRLRLAMFDARYHILLGDPCCRIAVGDWHSNP